MLIQLTPVQAEELLRVIGTDRENETLTEIREEIEEAMTWKTEG